MKINILLDPNSDRKLFASFSLGKSSCKMVEDLLKDCLAGRRSYNEIIILCANTGLEHILSMKFGKKCSDRWALKYGIPVTLVECEVNPIHGKPTTHKVVTFETAHMGRDLMESVIKKYGIPNKYYMHCTRELKEQAMYSYIKRDLGWEKGSYDVAIGIRYDEPKRLHPEDNDFYKEKLNAYGGREFHPLAQLGLSREDIFHHCLKMPFQLMIPEHMGNCIGCHKKGAEKLCTVLADEPTALDEWVRWGVLYKDAGAGTGDRKFYLPKRGDKGLRPAEGIIDQASNPNQKLYVDDWLPRVNSL